MVSDAASVEMWLWFNVNVNLHHGLGALFALLAYLHGCG
jgi:hypothetical protein